VQRDGRPRIQIPGIANEQFLDAFKVLDECLVTDVPAYGMTRPFMGPAALTARTGGPRHQPDARGREVGQPAFAEGVIENFMDVQDQNPTGVSTSMCSTIRARWQLEQSPRYFEVAYDIARRSNARNSAKPYCTPWKITRLLARPAKRDRSRD